MQSRPALGLVEDGSEFFAFRQKLLRGGTLGGYFQYLAVAEIPLSNRQIRELPNEGNARRAIDLLRDAGELADKNSDETVNIDRDTKRRAVTAEPS